MPVAIQQSDADRADAFKDEVRLLMTDGATVGGNPFLDAILSVADYDAAGSPIAAYNEAIALALIRLNQNGPVKFPTQMPVYLVAGLPSAADNRACWIQVADEVGGEVPAFSDGTNWRRCTDRAIVS